MLELLSAHRAFGGEQRFYRHTSDTIGQPMRFSVFVPPQAQGGRPLPTLFYLAGLTCTEETFPIKAGAQRLAAQLGLQLIAPDTSPRGAGVPGEDTDWDLGTGAGFYLDATQAPWSTAYRMESYIVRELTSLAVDALGADAGRLGVFGHSMGGHGALVLALRHPDLYHSVSAFAPITAPSQCPWGRKAFGAYLGPDPESWAGHDASRLMQDMQQPFPDGILIDQGLDDGFLKDGQLLPEVFEAACREAGQSLTLRRHPGYDHGYYFIASMVDDHLRFHARNLGLPDAASK
ncbi:MAG TPA: S-formylglutathione hydrolase [Castellaniella sp.]|nr:S-formylglutathione hydrolase [Castellaniella sp.]